MVRFQSCATGNLWGTARRRRVRSEQVLRGRAERSATYGGFRRMGVRGDAGFRIHTGRLPAGLCGQSE